MKTIEKNERLFMSFGNIFNLSDMYNERTDVPLGLLILFTIYYLNGFKCETLIVLLGKTVGNNENQKEIISRFKEKKIFKKLENLVEFSKKSNLENWEMSGKFKEADVMFSGKVNDTEVFVTIPLDSKVDAETLMKLVEAETFNYKESDSTEKIKIEKVNKWSFWNIFKENK